MERLLRWNEAYHATSNPPICHHDDDPSFPLPLLGFTLDSSYQDRTQQRPAAFPMAVMAFRLVVVALYLSCVVLATLAHEDRSNFTSPFGRRLPNSPHLSALHERSALPSESNFYALPHSLNQVPNGHVFRSRTLPYATHRRFGGDLVGKIEQLQYKYTMTGGIDDATVVTVLSPSRPAKGETKIVVIGLAEDSAARDCAPSYAFSHCEYKLPGLLELG